jgi:glutathione S-transferase
LVFLTLTLSSPSPYDNGFDLAAYSRAFSADLEVLVSSTLNNAQSWLVSVARGGRGLMVNPHNQANPPRPEQPLELYHFEACPFCRKVREVLSELDLAYISRPCAKGEGKNRAFVRSEGGQEQFPFLVDPNTDTKLFESEDIIDYLAETYGPGRSVFGKLASPLNTVTAVAAGLFRMRGARQVSGLEGREQPEELLELYNFEASPYCRKVRETLDELGLDTLVHNVAKKSARRPELRERGGTMMVPYLVDPNTDQAMYESDDIVAYLESTYSGR